MKYGIVVTDEKQHSGLFRKVESDYLHMPLQLPMSPTPLEDKISIEKTVVDKKTYNHIKFYFNDGDGRERIYGFWVPTEIKNPQAYIIDNLISRYVKGERND